MVNARTIAIGTFAVAGAGILAANSMGENDSRYTKYIVDKETNLYVNNEYTPISHLEQFKILGEGSEMPESGNAGFIEKNIADSDYRIVISASYGVMQTFIGGVESSCKGFVAEEHTSWMTFPEENIHGDFSMYPLQNGVVSAGPVGALIDPRDCVAGRREDSNEELLLEHALSHAEEHHGISKRELRESIKRRTAWASCNVGREQAILAYYDTEVGKYNQCKFVRWHVATDPWEYSNDFTRIAGSQLSGPGPIFKNTLADWACNLGYEGLSPMGAIISAAIPGPDPVWLFMALWRSLTQNQDGFGHRTEDPENPDYPGEVKSCYADYARKSKPCVDPAYKGKKRDYEMCQLMKRTGVSCTPPPDRRCVGHSLGGGTCAVGKAMDIFDNIVGINPVPSVTDSFDNDGTSMRYTWAHDIASFCLFKEVTGLQWGFSEGLRTYIITDFRWATANGGRGFTRTFLEEYNKAVGVEKPWTSGSCVTMIFPITMFSQHASSKANFRCPGESLTWSPSQIIWNAENVPWNPPTDPPTRRISYRPRGAPGFTRAMP